MTNFQFPNYLDLQSHILKLILIVLASITLSLSLNPEIK